MKFDSIVIQDITSKSLPFVQRLLFDRNRTLPEYTAWKYGDGSPQGFRGVVALTGDEPIGCFGLVPKKISVDGETIPTGWFADWYVIPSMRGSGLGTRLLREITSKGYLFYWGHPGPRKASKICLENGWEPAPFQSSRRYIFSPYFYYGRRTHYFSKRLFFVLKYFLDTRVASKFKNRKRFSETYEFARFCDEDMAWLKSQPVYPTATRTYHRWQKKGVLVDYFDDLMPSGERRRRILSIGNIYENPQSIFSFFEETKSDMVDYMEIFTTDPFMDFLLIKAGATQFRESPILWYAHDQEIPKALIQGFDRENWLYLAGEV